MAPPTRRASVIGDPPGHRGSLAADRYKMLLRCVDVVMLRDVMERHGVTNVAGLHWLVRHLLGNPGALFSVEKFHARLKSQGIAIARDTLHALLGYVEDCFLASVRCARCLRPGPSTGARRCTL